MSSLSKYIPFERSNYIPSRFSWDKISHSGMVTELPFFSLFLPVEFLKNSVEEWGLIFGLPAFENGVNTRRYESLYSALQGFQIRFFLSGELKFYVFRGCLYENLAGNRDILMLLTIDKEYAWELLNLHNDGVSREDISKELDPDKFKLYTSTSFLGARYKNVYKKILTNYIHPLQELGVDTVLTQSIAERCFPPIGVKSIFSTTEEREAFLTQVNSSVLYGN